MFNASPSSNKNVLELHAYTAACVPRLICEVSLAIRTHKKKLETANDITDKMPSKKYNMQTNSIY